MIWFLKVDNSNNVQDPNENFSRQITVSQKAGFTDMANEGGNLDGQADLLAPFVMERDEYWKQVLNLSQTVYIEQGSYTCKNVLHIEKMLC